jgi:hypothetical protein
MANWAQIGAAFVGSLNAAAGPARALLDEVAQWGTHLASNAAHKWVVRITTEPRPCHIPRCQSGAVIPCVSCGKPTCMRHAFLSCDAEGVCFECAGAHYERLAPEVERAFDMFGLEPDAELSDVTARYKKLAAEHHPDRKKGSVAKKKAEAFMKDLNGAMAILKKHFEAKEAA